MRIGRLLIGLAALTGIAGCAPGSGPNFMRLVNDTNQTVQVRELTQSNSPSCFQPGYVTHSTRVVLTPNGECVITSGRLAPGRVVAFSLGMPKDDAVLPPIVVVDGGVTQTCMVLPLPDTVGFAPGFRVSGMQPGGCD